MNLFPHFGQVISTFPFPFGTRSFCLQTGHLKKRNNLASACSSRFSIIFSHNGRASLRKHSFSCALLSWLRENTRKMQPISGRQLIKLKLFTACDGHMPVTRFRITLMNSKKLDIPSKPYISSKKLPNRFIPNNLLLSIESVKRIRHLMSS